MCQIALCVGAVALAVYKCAVFYYLSLPMAVKQTTPYNDGIYFITFTCYKWMPLIRLTNSYDLVYNWFDYLKTKGHYITGYVIMPNHIHSLIGFQNTGKSVNKIVGDGKRFIAYEIVKRLEAQGEFALLNQLSAAVEPADRMRGKKHEVWEDYFDLKDCRSHFFMNQKLDYMHGNPCTAKWNLALSPAQYLHSSARFYICGEQAAYRVTNISELDDVDLTKRFRINNAESSGSRTKGPAERLGCEVSWSTHNKYDVNIGDYFIINFSSEDPEHSKILYDFKLNPVIVVPKDSVWTYIPKDYIISGRIESN